ncbi:MAG: MBL fold metallo-hydrolase [Eggerthellaceae bacterium]|nr:MBL fold metallo-hydrolase [Eggerthellaceae bacterium]
MEIKAVKFRDGGFYTQPFIFGGEEGQDKFDPQIRYRGSLQNYLIDTGEEVILVDTGLPAGTPEEVPDETSALYTGKDVNSYMDAFAALGYAPEQVTKILLTHKHGDHSGELKSFPNARFTSTKRSCLPKSCKVSKTSCPWHSRMAPTTISRKARRSATASTWSRPRGTRTATALSSLKTAACSICSKQTSPMWTRRSTKTSFPSSSTTCRQHAKRWSGCARSCATNPRSTWAPTHRKATKTWKPSA